MKRPLKGVASASLALVLLAGCDAVVPDTSPGYAEAVATTQRPAPTTVAPAAAAPAPTTSPP
ncbi:MAG TPA: hypothetical protein VK988_04550, partial [Acidimicrobiales bacterium]|nr:hypothetical protein [Acidimicrobiales bacterium]